MKNQAEIWTEILQRFEKLDKAVPIAATPLADPLDLPDIPRAEMEIMFRHIATDADFPKTCALRRCRRMRTCTGKPGLPPDQSCHALWDELSADKFEAACFALILAWRAEIRRMCQRIDMIMPWLSDPADREAGQNHEFDPSIWLAGLFFEVDQQPNGSVSSDKE